MILGIEQLRALAELKRRRATLEEARGRYIEAESECWAQGISHRQIAAVAGIAPHTVYRRVTGQNVREIT